MACVALIGPDGAGKTTIGRQLEHALPMPARYLYMGVNLEASGLMLPTTRLMLMLKRARGGRPDMVLSTAHGERRPQPRHPVKRLAGRVKSAVRVTNWLAEEWFRQIVAWAWQRRGYLVVFDRHFFADYHAHDVAGNHPPSLARRLHGAVLRRYYPRPSLVVCLDAPAEVLFARKGEGTLAWLEARRAEYLALHSAVDAFVVVDASQPPDAVLRDVVAAITAHVGDPIAAASTAGGGAGEPAPASRSEACAG